MIFRKALAAFLSVSILLGSSAAIADADPVGNAAPVVETEGLGIEGTGWILALLGMAGLVLIITSGDMSEEEEEGEPTSP